jgi:hypothetical protein
MALTAAQKEDAQEVSAQDLATKLRLEHRQEVELRELFRNMSADMLAFVGQTGSAPNAQVYEDDVRGLLARQGRRTAKAFSGRVVKHLESLDDDDPIIQDLTVIATALGLTVAAFLSNIRNDTLIKTQSFIADQVARDTGFITRTNQKQMDAAVLSSRAALIESGEVPTNKAIAKASSKEFKTLAFNQRVPTIAATYTQKIAEGTKEIDTEAFLSSRNGFNALQAGVSQADEDQFWITFGDELVRGSHAAADSQPRLNGGWIVQNEFLRFPGDPNGSISNIARCRCSGVTMIGGAVVGSTQRNPTA